ncbi:hypothetical protein ACFQ1L_20020 [Phytohabitans flavus]|uniref:hypothetical protein n=1 Tax=Phytohabitans flavus TaxID=1076124 RepID=UPI00363EF57D
MAVHSERGVVRDARVCLGGVAPKPWRAHTAESALRGRRLDAAAIEAAAEAATAGAALARTTRTKWSLSAVSCAVP